MMHRLRRYDAFASQIWCCSTAFRNDAMFAQCAARHTSLGVTVIIRRSQHHLPRANIIQKRNFCLVDKSSFFVGAGDGNWTRTVKPHAPQTCASASSATPASHYIIKPLDCQMMHRLRRYDAFASQIWCCSTTFREWCDVCLKMWRSHTSLGVAVIIGQRPASFAEGKHHSKKEHLSW